MKLKKIGKVAKELGITTRTIRFYEEEGLLEPVRTSKGTRLYSEEHIRRLKVIKELRDMGIPLERIKSIVNIRKESSSGDEASKKVLSAFEELEVEVIKKIQLLNMALAEINSLKPAVSRCRGCTLKPTLENCTHCDKWEPIVRNRLGSLLEK